VVLGLFVLCLSFFLSGLGNEKWSMSLFCFEVLGSVYFFEMPFIGSTASTALIAIIHYCLFIFWFFVEEGKSERAFFLFIFFFFCPVSVIWGCLLKLRAQAVFLVWSDMVWSGLVWFGLIWSGLV